MTQFSAIRIKLLEYYYTLPLPVAVHWQCCGPGRHYTGNVFALSVAFALVFALAEHCHWHWHWQRRSAQYDVPHCQPEWQPDCQCATGNAATATGSGRAGP